jgi:PleD family two-component response regulator
MPTRVNKKTGTARVRKLAFPPPEHQRKDVKLLVISDDKTERGALGENLDAAGYEVLFETNPDNITDTMIDTRPEVVILDLGMRRIGGINILRQLKGDSQTRQATVITLGGADSANDGDSSRGEYAQSIALGARDMISKPWHPGDLQRRVGRAVDAARARKLQAERAAKRASARAQKQKTRRRPARQARRRRTPTR